MQPTERRGIWWRERAAVLHRWIARAAGMAPSGWALKTDLFDEASGPHHHAADPSPEHHFLGIDASYSVARAAKRRLDVEGRQPVLIVADCRALPLASGSIPLVLSLSTLDHFPREEDIVFSLQELRRALRADGCMFLTLDNPLNPEVALRARLPDWLVRRLRSETFPLGVTLVPTFARQLFAAVGWTVLEEGFLIHAPRYPLIRLARFVEKSGPRVLRAFLERVLEAFEGLAHTPLRAWTGHYAAWILAGNPVREDTLHESSGPSRGPSEQGP